MVFVMEGSLIAWADRYFCVYGFGGTTLCPEVGSEEWLDPNGVGIVCYE